MGQFTIALTGTGPVLVARVPQEYHLNSGVWKFCIRSVTFRNLKASAASSYFLDIRSNLNNGFVAERDFRSSERNTSIWHTSGKLGPLGIVTIDPPLMWFDVNKCPEDIEIKLYNLGTETLFEENTLSSSVLLVLAQHG